MSDVLARLRETAEFVRRVVAPTPQREWPLVSQHCGTEVWIKHENHAPTGSFKVRGGLTYLDEVLRSAERPAGIVAATRGNHGQSVAFAARAARLPATIVVPRGNSREKNLAMRGLDAELIEYGRDFTEALEHATELASERGLHFMPSFHPGLIRGIASYALEWFEGSPALDTVYVPIGLGSGICSVIAVRDALGLSTQVVGVVAERAPAYAHSFEAGHVVESDRADTYADGIAVRVPHRDAVRQIRSGAARILKVSDDEIAEASRVLFSHTHNVAEGAGAAALAGLLHERAQGERAGIVITGGNIDTDQFAAVLAGQTPTVD